jgi:hypothetical protein
VLFLAVIESSFYYYFIPVKDMLIIQTICRASFIYALNDIQTLILIHTNNANAPSIGNASAKTRCCIM